MKTVKNSSNKQSIKPARLLFTLGLIGVLSLSVVKIPFVKANSNQNIQQLKQEINQLEGENSHKQEAQGVLGIEASSLNDAINKLQEQINASEARVGQLQAEVDSLNKQIADAEIELAKQRSVMGESIKAMYLEGDMTTVEILAISKDLSDFFDKQQYRESVQSKIKTTLDTINKLKADLDIKRTAVKVTLEEQQSLSNQLAGQRAEKDRILALNQSQQNDLENQIRQNSGKLAELKKKQAAAEAALAQSLNSGSYRVASVGPVAAGDVVGAVGNTGFSSGPHLHLEVRQGRSVINPAQIMEKKPVNMPPAFISQNYNEANDWYSGGYHKGIDYASSSGSPIFAIAGGQMFRGCSADMLGTNAYGYVAIVEHGNGAKSIYAHMSGGPAGCNSNTFNR